MGVIAENKESNGENPTKTIDPRGTAESGVVNCWLGFIVTATLFFSYYDWHMHTGMLQLNI